MSVQSLNEFKVYGPHDEYAVAALRGWVEDVLAGNVWDEFQHHLAFSTREGFSLRSVWIGVKALKASGLTFSHKNDGVSWRLPCSRCQGEGQVHFEGAEDNRFTHARKEKDCFLCARRGYHVLPSPDRVCAAILVMALQTMNNRRSVDRPQRESLHAFLKIQMEYGDEEFGKDFDTDRCWETRILAFCFDLFFACYEDFASSYLQGTYPEVWKIGSAGYERFLDKDRKVKEAFSELQELCSMIAPE